MCSVGTESSVFSWYQIAATNTTQNPTPVIASREHFYFGLLETAAALAVTPASLEALLPCPGRREIYLREIVCEYCTYSNLCNPSELSLRTLKRYRSLYPLTRQCLQPEGIVQVYG